MQPAMAKDRPPPMRPAATEAPLPPGSPICPNCGTANELGRRFCRKCGTPLSASAEAPAVRPVEQRLSWWQRLKARLRGTPPSGTDPDRFQTARSAYRRSLDLRYRVLRGVALLGMLGLGIGALGFARINPVTGARDLWRELFPRYEPITEVTAASAPEALDRREFAAVAAIDGDPTTAWATGWQLGPDADPVELCPDVPGTGGADTALEITLPEASNLGKIEIQPGLPANDPERQNQWRPRLLELRYDDGTCDRVELDDEPGLQSHEIEVEDVTTVRIAILDATPPRAGEGDLVSLGEVHLFRQK